MRNFIMLAVTLCLGVITSIQAKTIEQPKPVASTNGKAYLELPASLNLNARTQYDYDVTIQLTNDVEANQVAAKLKSKNTNIVSSSVKSITGNVAVISFKLTKPTLSKNFVEMFNKSGVNFFKPDNDIYSSNDYLEFVKTNGGSAANPSNTPIEPAPAQN